MPQSFIGHGYTQGRNTFGSVDRIDYLGGVTFATQFGNKNQGISLSNYINITYSGNSRWDKKTFGNFVVTNPIYMHEYGHTIDSRRKGPFYLLFTAVPSIISVLSDKMVYEKPSIPVHNIRYHEMIANKHAKKYFGTHYNVNWDTDQYKGYSYEMFYPTIKR